MPSTHTVHNTQNTHNTQTQETLSLTCRESISTPLRGMRMNACHSLDDTHVHCMRSLGLNIKMCVVMTHVHFVARMHAASRLQLASSCKKRARSTCNLQRHETQCVCTNVGCSTMQFRLLYTLCQRADGHTGTGTGTRRTKDPQFTQPSCALSCMSHANCMLCTHTHNSRRTIRTFIVQERTAQQCANSSTKVYVHRHTRITQKKDERKTRLYHAPA